MLLLVSLFWGVFVPASILVISVVLTYWLYRRFSQAPPPPEASLGISGQEGGGSAGGGREPHSSP